MPAAPLIVTLTLDPASQAVLGDLRRRHFPPARNHLEAHVTLFHALPGEALREIGVSLEEAARRRPFDVAVTGVRLLGRGVAYTLRSPELDEMRDGLARRWWDQLTPQDRQPQAPHVTVQNKVEPTTARALHAELAGGFVGWTARAEGLGLWRYAGGPWEPVATYPLTV